MCLLLLCLSEEERGKSQAGRELKQINIEMNGFVMPLLQYKTKETHYQYISLSLKNSSRLST